MAKLYSAKRRPNMQSHRTYMHHLAWGILSIMLMGVVLSLMSYAQSLHSQNVSLQQQLAAKDTVTTVCRVSGSWQANTTTEQIVATPNGDRHYLVHLPESFKDNQSLPILMFYPGKGAEPRGAEAAYGLDSLPAVVVYPFPTESTDGFWSWQSAPYSSGSDDVAFTSAILDKIQGELCVDKQRVYAAGLSNGGGFVSLLSCALPDKFAAFAIVAGAMYYPDGGCTPTKPVSLMSIHGDKDPIVPYYGSAIRKLPSVDDWTTMRASMNSCGRSLTTFPDPKTVETYWGKCKNNTVVENLRIEGGGHLWQLVPNGTIWNFLTQFKHS